jgi:hypothetical protein
MTRCQTFVWGRPDGLPTSEFAENAVIENQTMRHLGISTMISAAVSEDVLRCRFPCFSLDFTAAEGCPQRKK